MAKDEKVAAQVPMWKTCNKARGQLAHLQEIRVCRGLHIHPRAGGLTTWIVANLDLTPRAKAA